MTTLRVLECYRSLAKPVIMRWFTGVLTFVCRDFAREVCTTIYFTQGIRIGDEVHQICRLRWVVNLVNQMICWMFVTFYTKLFSHTLHILKLINKGFPYLWLLYHFSELQTWHHPFFLLRLIWCLTWLSYTLERPSLSLIVWLKLLDKRFAPTWKAFHWIVQINI